MDEFLQAMGGDGFMPHGHCYLWDPTVLWLNVGSDLLIGVAYFSIPLALYTFVRKRPDVEFSRIFTLFAAFILACGSTHLIDVLTVWRPAYLLEGSVKAVTAAVSMLTAVVLWPLIPKAVALPSPTQLSAEIDERRAAEEALRELNAELEARVAARTAELERSNAELQSFASVASHDLKAPLRAISNIVEWLDEDLAEVELPPDSREHLLLLRQRTGRMGHLIDGILRFAQAGQKAWAPEPVDLQTLVTDELELLSPPAGAQIDIQAALPTFAAEPEPLRQVVRNLLGNALKYGGDPLCVEVRARDLGDAVEVTVRDEGDGIGEAQQQRIWQMFQRLDPDVAEGTGLGLALVKKLVEGRGGRVWVDSVPGAGATFGFTWPKSS